MKLQENLENQIFKAGAARMRSHRSVFTDEGRRGLSDHLHLALSLCILRSWGGRGWGLLTAGHSSGSLETVLLLTKWKVEMSLSYSARKMNHFFFWVRVCCKSEIHPVVTETKTKHHVWMRIFFLPGLYYFKVNKWGYLPLAQMIIITLSIRTGGIIMRKRDKFLSRGYIGQSGNTVE